MWSCWVSVGNGIVNTWVQIGNAVTSNQNVSGGESIPGTNVREEAAVS